MKKIMLLVILITTLFSCTELLEDLNLDGNMTLDSLGNITLDSLNSIQKPDTIIINDTVIVNDTVFVDLEDTVTDESVVDHPSMKLKSMGWASATTTGGKGGKIIKVTNLNRDGAGSLQEALNTSGPRIIVFEVGGIIDLEGSKLAIREPNVTILGQTAPSPGITLIKGPFEIFADNVIVQHLRIRVGDAGKTTTWEPDGICVNSAHNVIIDHCSVAWSIDESLSVTGPYFKGETVSDWRKNIAGTVTISNCIIGEPLHKSLHSKGSHGLGTLIGRNVRELAIIRNIYVNNANRNPLATGGTATAIVNNYVYNPRRWFFEYEFDSERWAGLTEVPGSLGIVGNNAKSGPETYNEGDGPLFFLHDGGNATLYWKDNRSVGTPFKSNRIFKEMSGKLTVVDAPLSDSWHSSIEVMSSQEAESFVLENAGARPWERDEVDIRIINGIKDGTLHYIDSQEEVGGYPKATPTYQPFDINKWNL